MYGVDVVAPASWILYRVGYTLKLYITCTGWTLALRRHESCTGLVILLDMSMYGVGHGSCTGLVIH